MDVSLVLRADGQVVRFDNLLGEESRTVLQGYELRTGRDAHDVVRIAVERRDGREMDVECLEFLVTGPLLNFSKIILPDSGREFVFKDKAVYLRSAPSGVNAVDSGFPFLALVDQTGGVPVAFGLVQHFRESSCSCLEPKISARKAMVGGADEATMVMRVPARGWRYGCTGRVDETVFAGQGLRTWFHALRRYADQCKRHHHVAYPENPAAWEPTWCTWTAWGSDLMTAERILENARVARELGIGTIIIDDGWFGPGLDEDDAELNIGDYAPARGKLPDLRGLIGELRALELKTLLWYAPTCVAPGSHVYRKLRPHLIAHEGEKVEAPNGSYNLCPDDPVARAHVCAEIERMMEEYGPDGFKVDLYNTLPRTPCDAPHTHSSGSMVEGVRRMMAETWEALVAKHPDALVELKQNHGNVLDARYGTMVRAGDTAYDIDTNLWRCFYLQAYAPVVHNDYLAASIHESPRDLAIMMIKMLTAGVPTFSMDLVKQSKRNLAVLKAWLAFYREHLPDWQQPREPITPRMDVWRMGGRQTAILSALFDAAEVMLPTAREVWVLNGTGRAGLYIGSGTGRQAAVDLFDYRLKPRKSVSLTLCRGEWLDVPSGGAARIRREPTRKSADGSR